MRDYHCLHCGKLIGGNFKGRNLCIKHNGGLLHTECEYYYKEQMRKKWREPESWNKYIHERNNNDKHGEYMKMYMKKYVLTDKYRKYHREYIKTDIYRKYRREYLKSEKYRKYHREYRQRMKVQ